MLPQGINFVASLCNAIDETTSVKLTTRSTIIGREHGAKHYDNGLQTFVAIDKMFAAIADQPVDDQPTTETQVQTLTPLLKCISKQHCCIIFDDHKKHFLLINRSKNGVLVNGKLVIGEPVVLQDGSTIEFKFFTKTAVKNEDGAHHEDSLGTQHYLRLVFKQQQQH